MLPADASFQADLIAVLGVHRSGTSTVARAAKVFGADLGDRLMPPNPDENAKGYWEDLDIYELNVAMLDALGREWHWLQPITPADVQMLKNRGFMLRAMNLLKQKMAGKELFCFKDPRLCKLLPFWFEVFQRRQLRVCYTVSLRNPLSVASSLMKRNGFPAEKCYFLWLEDIVNCVGLAVRHRNCIVDYDDLLKAPAENLRRLGSALRLRVNETELRTFESEFVEASLRHSEFDVDDLELDPSCPPLVREVYSELRVIARETGFLDPDVLAVKLGDWEQQVKAMQPALRFADGILQSLAGLRGQAARQDAAATEAAQRLAEQHDTLQAALARAGELDGRIRDLVTALEEQQRRTAEAEETLARAQARLQEMEQAAQASEMAASQQAEQLRTVTRERDGARKDVDEHARRGFVLRQMLQEADEKREQLSKLLSDAKQTQQRVMGDLASRIAERDAEAQELRTAHADAQAEHADLQRRLSAAQLERDGLASENEARAAAADAKERVLSARIEELGREAEEGRRAQERASALAGEVARLQADIAESGRSSALLHQRLQTSESDGARLREQATVLNARIAELNRELEVRDTRDAELKARLADSEASARLLEQTVGQRETAISALEEAGRELRTARQQVETRLAAEQSARDRLQEALRESERAKAAAGEQLDRAHAELAATRQRWDEQQASENAERAKLQEALRDRTEAAAATGGQLAQALAANRRLEQQVREGIDQIQMHHDLALRAQQREAERQAEGEQLRIKWQQASAELSETSQTLRIREMRVGHLEEAFESKDQDFRALAATLEATQRDLAAAREQVAQRTRSVERLQKEISTQAHTVEELIQATVRSNAVIDKVERSWLWRLVRRLG